MASPFPAPSEGLTVDTESLNSSAFAPFGTVITSPLPTALSVIPEYPADRAPLYSSHQPEPVIANQSTALKYSPISPIINNYQDGPSHGPGKPLLSMFSCFPRNRIENGRFEVKILERHPFTTQTFAPLGLSADDPDTRFLVIVAPSLSESRQATTGSGARTEIQHPPDLRNLKAFVANGAQAVTYGPGTWHAPMVVLGKRRVDFVVTQFVSGVAEEDCQDVEIDEGIVVRIRRDSRGPRL